MRCGGVIASVAWVRCVGAGAGLLDGSGPWVLVRARGDSTGAAVSMPPGWAIALVAVGAWESAPLFGPRFVFATAEAMRDIYGA